MSGARRWEQLIGGSVLPVLRPLLATVGLAVTGQYVVLAYFAIFAVRELPLSPGRAGLGFAVATCFGLAAGPLGGALSDRLGRRGVITAGLALQAGACLGLLAAGARPVPAFAAFTLFSCGLTLRWAAQQALVGDLAGDADRDQAFAVMRTVFNVGASVGPPLGAALVLVGWPAVWAGSLALALAALRLARGLPAGTRPPAGRGGAAAAALWRGRRPRAWMPSTALACALAASVLAWTVYHGFEVLLPVSLTQVHGYPPAAWGLLFLVNPIAVVLLQVRLVRWTAAIPRPVRLAAAMLLMGVSFMALPLGASVGLVLAAMVLFVLGEMLWGPTAQGLVTALAPPGARGAVMGVLASTTTAGGALASGVGLGILEAAGDTAMWLWVLAVAVTAAVLWAVAARPAAVATPAPAPARG